MDGACGVSSIAVKGTEVNSVNSLKIKHFRVFGQPSEGCLDTRFFLLRNISTAIFRGRVDRIKMAKVELIERLCGGLSG